MRKLKFKHKLNYMPTSPYGSVKFDTVDAYHQQFSEPVQQQLAQLRNTIAKAAPKAKETISYNMPAFKANKVLVYYAAYKNHIGFYPTPKAIIFFKDQLLPYKTSKGAIQFPLRQPLPLTLIKAMVQYRVKEDDAFVVK